jgi:AcrR family transcriptional regulator
VAREVREREMLAVAAREFGRRGFQNSSMDLIAAASGVSKPMLYAYFGSKEGLFVAAAENAGDRLRTRVREVVEMPGLAPDQRLWAGFLEVFAFVEEHRDAWLVLYPAGTPTTGDVGAGARRARDAMGRLLVELFRTTALEAGMGEQAAAQSEMLAHAVTGATIASASWWLEQRDEPKELPALRLMNLVWNGFGGIMHGQLWAPPP